MVRWKNVLVTALLSAVVIALGGLVAAAPATALPGTIATVGTSTARSASGTVIAVARPAGASAGHVVVVRVGVRNSGVSVTPPGAGGTNDPAQAWTTVGETRTAGYLRSVVFTHVVTGADPATYAFTLSGSAPAVATATAFSGVETTSPVGGWSGKVNGGSSGSTFTTPAVRTTLPGEVGLWFGLQVFGGGTCPADAVPAPGGFTERADGCVTGAGLAFNAATRTLGSSVGHQPTWWSTSPAAVTNITQALTLRPAGARTEHRSTSSAALTGATALTLRTPSGTAAGDLLLARVAARNLDSIVSVTMTAPAGWSLVRVDRSTYSVKSWIFSRTAMPGEPGSATFTLAGAGNRTIAGTMSSFTGVDVLRPVESSAGKYNGSTATMASSAIAPVTPAGLGVWFGTVASGSECATVRPPSGATERIDTCLATSAGLTTAMATATLDSPGWQTMPAGAASVAATNLVQMVALRPTISRVGQFLVPLSQLNEGSGLAASRRNPGVLYTHSEKAAGTMLALDAATATVRARYSLSSSSPIYDWEDIATGPCAAGSCIFAGDIGASRGTAARTTSQLFAIVRAPEPSVADAALTGDRFPFRYPSGACSSAPNCDAEALMVHPASGEVFIITKVASGASALFSAGVLPASPAGTITLTKVADLTVPPNTADANHASVTAASIHPTENRFLVRTYRAVYEYSAPSGGIAQAAKGARLSRPAPREAQGESLEYDLGGRAFFTMSEVSDASPKTPYTVQRVYAP